MSSVTLLLADDDADDTEMFCEALLEIKTPTHCYTAENGKQALQILADMNLEKPQLIFLDINMPIMGGWECLKRIKGIPEFKDTPVIMYSTVSQSTFVEKAMALGAFCLFTKPEDYKDLKMILSVMITNLHADLRQSLERFKNISFG
jgi:CheY-like chemotaxis protein